MGSIKIRPPQLRCPDMNNFRHPLWVAAGVFFIFAAVASLLVQTFILPVLFPTLHAGDGMLVGTDAHGFHEIAINLSSAIHEHGWSYWKLRPDGQAPAGMAAVLYALLIPNPMMMIPLNAAMHALAGITLMHIMLFLSDNKNHAFLAATPFVIFPSAMTWYSQIHKDGFYLAGIYLCIFGWIIMARRQSWDNAWKSISIALFCWLMGATFAGVVRIYAFVLLQGVGYIFAIGLSVIFFLRGLRHQLPWRHCFVAITLLFLLPYALHYAPREVRTSAEIISRPLATQTTSIQNDTERNDNARRPRTKKETPAVNANAILQEQSTEMSWLANEVERHWQTTAYAPTLIENNFLKISVLREGYLTTPDYRSSGSMLDTHIHLNSIGDFVSYLPRASMIGFAAPFPTNWLTSGKSQGGSIMRKIAGLEMLYSYLSFVCIPFALWHWRKRVEMWLPVLFATLFIFIYTYATPNLGSLYRLRYGFTMILVSFGTLAGLHFWQIFRDRNRTSLT